MAIGAGTGQLSMPLAQQGIPLMAVELGGNLATVLRRRLQPYPQTDVIVADFDDWSPSCGAFDLIVAATAFHWLNPEKRLQKCVSLLKPGGRLAIIETHWGAGGHDDEDAFGRESQSCYAQWNSHGAPPFLRRPLSELSNHQQELETSDLFNSISHRRYVQERQYSAAEYRDLMETFSDVRTLPVRQRQGLLACIHALIQNRFGGSVIRHDVYDLWLASRGTI